ncbi:MAG: RNA methyltransferase substrate-binding domain-containing protein, partial [Candidatus Acidiferrales bacterium]
MDHLAGFHAVEEALAAGRPLDRILVARGQHGGRIQKILDLARSRGVPVRFEDRVQLDRAAAAEHHQGVVAFTASRETLDIEDLLAGHSQRDAQAADQLLVLLDGIE